MTYMYNENYFKKSITKQKIQRQVQQLIVSTQHSV